MNSEENIDNMDGTLRDIFNRTGKQLAPEDFTRRVMDKIETQPALKGVTYQPIISSGGWIIISLIILSLIAYTLYLSGSESETGYFRDILKNFDLTWLRSWLGDLGSRLVQIQLSSKVILSLLAIIFVGFLEILLRQKLKLKRWSH